MDIEPASQDQDVAPFHSSNPVEPFLGLMGALVGRNHSDLFEPVSNLVSRNEPHFGPRDAADPGSEYYLLAVRHDYGLAVPRPVWVITLSTVQTDVLDLRDASVLLHVVVV